MNQSKFMKMGIIRPNSRARARLAASAENHASSTDESMGDIHSLHSAPALSRKEPSDDHHPTPRFREAMQNPNWRQRRLDNTSSESTDTDVSNWAFPEPEIRNVSEVFGSSSSSVTNQYPGQTFSWDHIGGSYKGSTSQSSSELDNRHVKTPQSETMDQNTTYPGEGGLCGVLRSVDVPAAQSNGRFLKLIEIVPCCGEKESETRRSSEEGGPQFDLVRIQRISHVEDQRLAGRVANRPTPEALQHIHDDQERARREHLTRHWHKYHRMKGSQATGVEVARRAVLDDPAVASIGNSYRAAEAESMPNIRNGAPYKSQDSQGSIMKEKSEAFQKMLQKLHKGADHEAKAEVEAHNKYPGTPGHGAQSQPNGTYSHWGSEEILSKNKSSRQTNSSDSGISSAYTNVSHGTEGSNFSGVGSSYTAVRHEQAASNKPGPPSSYTTANHDKESSKDSGIVLDTMDWGNTLNPKATEFNTSDPGYHPVEGVNGEQRLGSSALVNSSSPPSAVSTCGPSHILLGNVSNGTFPPAMGGVLVPTTIPPAFGPLPGFDVPYVFPGPVGLQSEMSHPVPLNGPFTPPGYFGPHMRPQFQPGFPVGAGSLPKPVAKPHHPDAQTQQEYERWVEFRKSMEPGYAKGCRLRQQKRARRAFEKSKFANKAITNPQSA
ncbi:hypothetical protein G7046_g7354 [Stylonectria norvegica]|nr:hypothetical protein G7046_g7354 [Stylonectria norvegica]